MNGGTKELIDRKDEVMASLQDTLSHIYLVCKYTVQAISVTLYIPDSCYSYVILILCVSLCGEREINLEKLVADNPS